MSNLIDFLLKIPIIFDHEPSPEIYIKFGEWLQLEDVFKSVWISFMGMLVKGIYSLTHGVEQAFNFVFQLTGFTTYSKLNNFQKLFVAIGFALLSLSIVLFAVEMILGRRLSIHTMLVNVAVVLGIVIALPQAMGILNQFAVYGTTAVENKGVGLGSSDTSSMSLAVIKDNVVDVGILAQNSFQKTPNDIVINGRELNGFTDANLKAVDFGTMIKAGNKNDTGNRTGDYEKYVFDNTNGKAVLEYGLNSTPENGNSWKNSVVKVSESHWVFKTADTGYQRYVFSFFPIMIQSLVLILLFVFAGMRVVKLIFELGIMRTLAVITAFSNLKSSQKAKELVSTIFWSYMSIVMQLAMIKIFMIFINYGSATVLGAANLNLAGKGFVTIILYVGAFYGVFSGSGYIDRLAGVQSGSSSEAQQLMATFGGARLISSATIGGIRTLSGNAGGSANSTPLSSGTNPNLNTGLDQNGGINQNANMMESSNNATSSSNNEVQADSKSSQENYNKNAGGEQNSVNNNDSSNNIASEKESSQSVNEVQNGGDSVNDTESGSSEVNSSNAEAETSNIETNSSVSSKGNSSSNTNNSNNLANGNGSGSANNGSSGSYNINSNLQNANMFPDGSVGNTNDSTFNNFSSGSYATNSNLESSQNNDNYINRPSPNLNSDPIGTQETTNNINQNGSNLGSNNFGYGSQRFNGNKPEISNPSVEYKPANNPENHSYGNGNENFVGRSSSSINNFDNDNNGEYTNSNLKARPKIDTAVPSTSQQKNNLESTFPNEQNENFENENPNSAVGTNINVEGDQIPNNSNSQNPNSYDSNEKIQTNYDTNNMYNTSYGSDNFNSNENENSTNFDRSNISEDNQDTNSYFGDNGYNGKNDTSANVTQAMQNFQQSISNDPILNGKSEEEDDVNNYI